MAYPHLFPSGKYGYKVKRDITLSANKYFNQWLLNYPQAFSEDSEYIFFAHLVMLRIQFNSYNNIAIQKITSSKSNVGMLDKNFKLTVKQFIVQYKAYSFINSIKGTPVYRKRIINEVLAIAKHLYLWRY